MGLIAGLLGAQNTYNPNNAPTQYNPYIQQQLQATQGIQQQQQALAGSLANQAAGGGPNLAATQLQAGTDRNIQQAAALGASQRGISPGTQARNILNTQAQTNQASANQAAQLRQQQQLLAQGQEAGVLGTLGQQNLGGIGTLGGLQGQVQGLQAGISGQNAGLASTWAQNLLGGSSAAAGQASAGGGGKSSGGLLGALGLFAEGGKVDGQAEYPGNDERNDKVRAMLSPGEIVVPRSEAHKSPQEIAQFIIKARQNKYADGGEVKTGISKEQTDKFSKGFEQSLGPQQSPSLPDWLKFGPQVPQPQQPVLQQPKGYDEGGEVEADEPTEQQLVASPDADQSKNPATPPPSVQQAIAEEKGALSQQQAGITGQAQAQAGAGSALENVYNNAYNDVSDFDQAVNEAQMKRKAESDQLFAEAQSGKIDPNRFWSSRSSGQKVAGLVGAFLGGLGGGSVNPAVSIINKAIDNDIQAQQANVQHGDNLLSFNLQRSKYADEANLQTRRNLLDGVQTQVQSSLAKYSSPEALARGQQLVAGIEQQKAKIDQQLGMFSMQYELRNKPFNKAFLPFANPADQAKAVVLPDGNTAALAITPEAAKTARQEITNYQPLLDTINRLEGIRSAVLPITEKRAQAESLRASAGLQLNQLYGLKRLSPEELKLMQGQLSDPSALVDAIHGPVKTEALKKTIYSKLDATLKNAIPAYQSPNAVMGARPKRRQ